MAPQGAVIPSPEKAARLARGDTSAVMKRSHNGEFPSLLEVFQAPTFTVAIVPNTRFGAITWTALLP